MGSDYGCDCKRSKDDGRPGGGQGVRWDQIMDASAKGAETTHFLDVERGRVGVRSQMQMHMG
jgi:hypothetical protein